MLKITYVSHSNFILEDGEYTILIDPFYTGNPTAAFDKSKVKPDFIIVTHAHGDHLGDAIALSKQHGALVIAVNELGNYINAQGGNAHCMHIGGSYNFPFGKVKFTIAHHGSSNHEGVYMGEPAGVVLHVGDKIIYHTGDTGIFMDMKLIGELDEIDVMMLPIGGNFTMGVDDAVKAVKFVDPKLAIPIHFNTFPVIKADPEEFKRKVESLGKKAIVMKYGETIEIE